MKRSPGKKEDGAEPEASALLKLLDAGDEELDQAVEKERAVREAVEYRQRADLDAAQERERELRIEAPPLVGL